MPKMTVEGSMVLADRHEVIEIARHVLNDFSNIIIGTLAVEFCTIKSIDGMEER